MRIKILLLVSSFNGLTQRAWCAVREAGHDISVELAIDEQTIISGVEAAKPDLVLCPFLKERVPARVWQAWRTVIIHPGPVGDRGPSALDHAIMKRLPTWGVTALQAGEEMDAGPNWTTRTFPMPAEAPRKSVLYNGPVADAALECVLEVAAEQGKGRQWRSTLDRKAERARRAAKPLSYFETRELAEMAGVA
jgi:putative two-component system hydrogenase maturation factor HypX/HoxX